MLGVLTVSLSNSVTILSDGVTILQKNIRQQRSRLNLRDYPSDCVNRKLREKSCSFFYLYINFVKRIFYGHSQRIFK